MSLDDLGSLGEIISAISVLATLVYLAAQVKQSRFAAEQTAKFAGLQATQGIVSLYTGWRRILFSDPEHREIIAKANSGEALSDSEQIALSLLFHDLFFAACFSYSSATSAVAIHHESTDIEYVLLMMKDMPCSVAEWNRIKRIIGMMNPVFVTLLDAEIEKVQLVQPSVLTCLPADQSEESDRAYPRRPHRS